MIFYKIYFKLTKPDQFKELISLNPKSFYFYNLFKNHWQCSKTTKTGCLLNPTLKSLTPSFRRWDSKLNFSPSNKCSPLKNGLLKWSPNQYSEFFSFTKSLLSNLSMLINKTQAFILNKFLKISSSWNNTLKMLVELSAFSISFWTQPKIILILFFLNPILINSETKVNQKIQTKEARFLRKVNLFWKNTNQHLLEANHKSNHNVIRISYLSFSSMEDCTKWMDSNNVQSIMDLAHKNSFWQKAVKSFNNSWEETPKTFSFQC